MRIARLTLSCNIKVVDFDMVLDIQWWLEKGVQMSQYKFLTTTVDKDIKRRFVELARRNGETSSTRLRKLVLKALFEPDRRKQPQ